MGLISCFNVTTVTILIPNIRNKKPYLFKYIWNKKNNNFVYIQYNIHSHNVYKKSNKIYILHAYMYIIDIQQKIQLYIGKIDIGCILEFFKFQLDLIEF